MRARNIKPGFFKNEYLSDLDAESRLFFIGLWCYSDREGFLEWHPRRIKAEIFPYNEVNVGKLLATLVTSAFVQIYKIDGKPLIVSIPNFKKHQRPHCNEIPSILKDKLNLATLVESTYYQGDNHLHLNEECGMMNDERGMRIEELRAANTEGNPHIPQGHVNKSKPFEESEPESQKQKLEKQKAELRERGLL